jgi:hypothetical protein
VYIAPSIFFNKTNHHKFHPRLIRPLRNRIPVASGKLRPSITGPCVNRSYKIISTNILPVAIFALLAIRCAGQAPPPGGPPDTTEPSVINTYPEPQATHFNDTRVVLEFSEYVDRRSVEESIFISPDVSPLEFNWSGMEVEIMFGQKLKENVTYVVTVGTDVVDLRNNKMAESFSLPFSTGAVIDSGSLHGKVYDPKPDGVTIFAYSLDRRLQDTLNPAKVKPDYVTQTGKDGSFKLDYLSLGRYRLYAVRDQYKNILYEPQVDQIGMAAYDFELSSERRAVSGIQFQLTVEDTTPPFVLDAEAVHKNLVKVRFGETMDIAGIKPTAFSVIDTFSLHPTTFSDLFFDPYSANAVHLITADLDSAVVYRVTVSGMGDTAGNSINPEANSASFRGSSSPDTVIPRITFVGGLQDSIRDVLYDKVFEMVFNKGVKRDIFERRFGLFDSTGQTVSGTFMWWNSAVVCFTPTNPLQPLAWYAARLQLDSVQDLAGHRVGDSTVVRRFQTMDWRKFGSIKGRVEDPLRDAVGEIVLFAISITDKTAAPVVKRLRSAGEIHFEYLLEGQYVLQAFRDRDANGKYSHGKAFPFVPSERFAVYPDTIKIRARWPVEGVVVRFGD